MAQARHQRERHGVGDVGGDDARQRQVREHQQQHRHTDGPGAHRGKGHQQANDRPQQHRQAPVARLRGVGGAAAACGGSGGSALGRKNQGLVQRGRRCQQQRHAEGGGHHALRLGTVGPKMVQRPQAQQRGRNAAGAQQAHHTPRHQALARQAHGAAHLGECGEQQVGADGQVRLDAEEKNERWRHQRAAAHAGQADDQAHTKARQDEREIMHGRECRSFLYQNKLLFSLAYIQITL